MSELTRWESMSRWSPWKELEDMEKRLSTIFGRAPMPTSGETKEAISVAKWSPLSISLKTKRNISSTPKFQR